MILIVILTTMIISLIIKAIMHNKFFHYNHKAKEKKFGVGEEREDVFSYMYNRDDPHRWAFSSSYGVGMI